MNFKGQNIFRHDTPDKTGILLVNLGTPDRPDAASLRPYLKQFLSDPRVVEAPRLLWWAILNLAILRVRPKRSARAYASIWSERGSPLMVNSMELKDRLAKRFGEDVVVDLAMTYGNPPVAGRLEALAEANVRRLLVIPMFPQYSGSTSGAVFDCVTRELGRFRWLPEFRFVSSYFDMKSYPEALAESVRRHRRTHQAGRLLLFSFHGIPQRYFNQGDPYFCHCQHTARRVAQQLELADDQWRVTFQSRFGREPWLEPYTDKTLEKLAAAGVDSVDVICPGFATDCVETLEEIDQENRRIFLDNGGRAFSYIPCLNAGDSQVDLFEELIRRRASDWLEQPAPGADELAKRRERALETGADPDRF